MLIAYFDNRDLIIAWLSCASHHHWEVPHTRHERLMLSRKNLVSEFEFGKEKQFLRLILVHHHLCIVIVHSTAYCFVAHVWSPFQDNRIWSGTTSNWIHFRMLYFMHNTLLWYLHWRAQTVQTGDSIDKCGPRTYILWSCHEWILRFTASSSGLLSTQTRYSDWNCWRSSDVSIKVLTSSNRKDWNRFLTAWFHILCIAMSENRSGETILTPCSSLHKNDYVVIKNRPCKIIEVTTSQSGQSNCAK